MFSALKLVLYDYSEGYPECNPCHGSFLVKIFPSEKVTLLDANIKVVASRLERSL